MTKTADLVMKVLENFSRITHDMKHEEEVGVNSLKGEW